jgi:hypothetical protein
MRATLSFNLPEETSEFDAALQGVEASTTLWQIDRHCKSILKHCEPDEGEQRLAEEIRAMIADSGVSLE